MRKLILATALLAAVPAFAQEPQSAPSTMPPVSIQILQNTVGQLVGQNAMLSEQVQKLSTENAQLRQQLTEAQKKVVPEPKTVPLKK